MVIQSEGDVQLYTPDQIAKRIQGTLLFILSDFVRDEPSGLDEALCDQLLARFKDLEQGLKAIFQYRLPLTDYSAIGFAGRQENPPPRFIGGDSIML